MKKLMLAAVVAAVGALGVAGVASAIQGGQTITAKVTNSNAGTKSKPRSVGTLTVTTGTTPTPDEAGKFATKTAVIYFDKNLVFSPSKFKTCAATQVVNDDTKCPSGSKVGTGSATAVFANQNITLTVKAYNGPNSKLSLLVDNAQFGIHNALQGKLGNATGKYGKKLTVTIPDNLQQPLPGQFATLTKFVTKVRGTSKGTPYVGLKGCSGGKLNFKGVFNFTDGTSKTATSTAKCKK